jgi:hypothetical protein
VKLMRKIAVVMSALAFGAVPAAAIAANHGKSGGSPGHTKSTPSTKTNTSTNSKAAYGRICLAQGASKKHVAGMKGTPFSQCVLALAHADKSTKTSASSACSAESKKHVKGSKGTPFSECVAAVAKLRSSTKS